MVYIQDRKAGDSMKVARIIKRLICLVLVIGICLGAVVAGQGYFMYKSALEKASLTQTVQSIRDKENYTTIDQIPQTYLEAVVSVEDHRFYNHFGLDPLAIGRALVNDIKAGAFVEGGSTITQQLAKNMFFNQEKELTRKAAEVFAALDIERNYTKDEILELYVNSIYFGSGYYCVRDASEGYFDKEPMEMTEYESTLLAGIPNAPSVYDPTVNPRLAQERQRQVISRMVKYGYFSPEEAASVQVQMN